MRSGMIIKQIRRKHKWNDSRLPALVCLVSVLALLVLTAPKSPIIKAANASASGQVSTHAGIRISEVMSDNASALPDEGGKFGDWVEIENTLDSPINIKGVGLSDRSDRIKFLFPDVTLNAKGQVIVFCDSVNKDDPRGEFHAKFKLSSLGDYVYLFDANGTAIDSVKVPTLNADESYARDENGNWEKTGAYSPGYPNTQEGYEAYLAAYSVHPGMLMINEVTPIPRSGLRDEDGELSDWVELYNASNKDIKLGSYALSDDETKPVKWPFPKDAVIPAGGYYIVFCSGKDKVEQDTRYPHTNFKINNEQDTIILSTLLGELVDRVVVTNVDKDMSYGHDDSGDWKVFTLPTPGAPNNEYGAGRADQYIRALNPTGVYISEVVSSANLVKPFSDADSSDFVELYNASSQTWDMSGWGLSDNINWPRKWTFPQGTSIAPGEYKVVMLDGTDASQNGRLKTSFKLSHMGDEMMTLSDADGRVLDRLYLPEIPTDKSYGRTLGSNSFFYYDTPTPGAANGQGFTGFAAKPVFDHPSGLYYGELKVALSAAPGVTIRYTIDGSIPTPTNSEVYTEPIEIFGTKVIRARCFQDGRQPSETATASYFMELYHTLDVVSLVCDPYELWNTTNGLISDAPDLNKTPSGVVDKSKLPVKTPLYRTYGKDDRQGYVEIFSHDTKKAYISQGVKMDLMGDFSLDMPQKSFKLRAQAAYGSKYFNYPLFDHRDYTYYKSFTLRNSGNDCVWTRIADGVQTRLIDQFIDTSIITLDWKPIVVYLNGQYWGHYNMRERKDEYCIAQHEGIYMEDAKEIIILRGNSTVVQGSNTEYLKMRSIIQAGSPNTNQEDRVYLDENIDIASYLDWFAIKMFFGDSDPGNIMFYRIPGGKWKCLIFDLDYGMFRSYFDSPASYTKESGMGDKKINNVIFNKILEVDEYKDLFLRKIGNIYKALTTEVMQNELDKCVSVIKPEMPMHFNRWAKYNDKNINSDSPQTADGAMRYWEERIRRMRDETMVKRPYWIYTLIQKTFALSAEDMVYYFGDEVPQNPEKN